jgi:hypothetical protein
LAGHCFVGNQTKGYNRYADDRSHAKTRPAMMQRFSRS